MEIKDRRVLVTGANRGLGRALALACLKAGAREVLAGMRRPENLKETFHDERLKPVALDASFAEYRA